MTRWLSQLLPAEWTRAEAADMPVVDGWEVELSAWGVYYARRIPDRVLTLDEVRAGLSRYLVARAEGELLQQAEEQHRIANVLRAQPPVCPYCGRSPGDAPLIVTVNESSVTAGRCARSYQPDAACGHEDVEWTYQRPLPDRARCRTCGTLWRMDLIPYSVAERLTGGIPPREDVRPSADERKRS
jgi:hypothetical protein